MTTIVKGHGARIDDQMTFVPVGTTLRLYSGFDVDLSTTVALVAIASGASATATETVTGTGTVGDVANYELGSQDDQFVAKWLAMGGESGIPIEWVGPGGRIPDDTRLCESPDVCNSKGEHTCLGVLGLVKDTDIVLLACRGYVNDTEDQYEGRYGTDKDDPLRRIEDDADRVVDEILDQAKSDPAAAEARVDSLPQASMALLINRNDFDTWTKARYLKDLANAGDFTQLIGHLRANADDLDDIMDWLDDIPSYGDAVDGAVLRARHTGSDPLATAPAEVKDALEARPAIAAAATGSVWQPKDADLDQVTELNRANVKATDDGDDVVVKAGGLLVLIGSGHSADAQAYVVRQNDFEDGRITVTKGGVFSKGKLAVKGISAKQDLVETALGEISDKTVSFT